VGSSSPDIAAILRRRFDNGGDHWATADGRVYVGNPFSTIAVLGMLHELGLSSNHEAVQGGLDLILRACRNDGRIQVAPGAPMYPCYAAEAVRILCRFGLTEHEAVRRSVSYMEEVVHEEGGWRCNFTKFGKGPETNHANPGATLYALDVLRFFTEKRSGAPVVEQAVEFLLNHWTSRMPIGPCHWGIGSRFMQLEYPFLRYNLFFYVYVLSFFARARRDSRFQAAVAALESKLNADGQIVVESPHRALKGLVFCAKGRPSDAATRRYREIVTNLSR